MEVARAMLKTVVEHTRLTFDSIFYLGTITRCVYPSANRTLLLQERTGHLGAQPGETNVYQIFSFVRHFEFSSGLPLYTRSQTPVPGCPLPVARSPAVPVLVTSLQDL